MGQWGGYITNAVFVIVGALGSKLGAQLILGSNNVGWIGYGMNAIVGGVLWWVTETVMKNREASSGIVAGTIVEIILRIINDMTPFGSYVSGLGMGDYQMQSFVTPQVLVDPWNSAALQIPPGWGAAPMLPAGPPASGSMGAPTHAAAAAAAAPTAPTSGMGAMYGPSYDSFSSY